MARNRATAKKAGTVAERLVTERMNTGLGTDTIERRRLSGKEDRGDLAGVRLPDGRRVAVEVKNTSKAAIGPWLKEAEVERVNDGAAVGLVVAKRVGVGETRVGEWLVCMTLDDLIVMLGGERGA